MRLLRINLPNLCPNMNHFDAVDFSECHSEEVMFLLTLSVDFMIVVSNTKSMWLPFHFVIGCSVWCQNYDELPIRDTRLIALRKKIKWKKTRKIQWKLDTTVLKRSDITKYPIITILNQSQWNQLFCVVFLVFTTDITKYLINQTNFPRLMYVNIYRVSTVHKIGAV